jgi:hypothetical protein
MSDLFPGLKFGHQIITLQCRFNRGPEGAFAEAVNRLFALYKEMLPLEANEDASYHLMITVERATDSQMTTAHRSATTEGQTETNSSSAQGGEGQAETNSGAVDGALAWADKGWSASSWVGILAAEVRRLRAPADGVGELRRRLEEVTLGNMTHPTSPLHDIALKLLAAVERLGGEP